MYFFLKTLTETILIEFNVLGLHVESRMFKGHWVLKAGLLSQGFFTAMWNYVLIVCPLKIIPG